MTRSFAGAALRMTLSATTLANAQLLAVRANAATRYFVFSMISDPSINKHNCGLWSPLHQGGDLIARITAAETFSSGITRHFIR
ncbi:hypothetical protein SBC1_10310 [Caballeronia sp. SBC1]|nr:hypothetical protein SBC2_11710 [Caballeronia sp. SBC2]QIN61046.1 hypothetical protein SBC1_10310 [Caballeronia sp. SBC1]